MKKSLSISLIAAAILGVVIPASHASPSTGAACAKVGSIQGLPKSRFICVQVGKKQVWQPLTATNSKPAPATTSSSSSTASNQAAMTNLTIPISLPVPQTGSITFANAESNFASIPEVAWQRTQDVMNANPAVSIPTEIHIGPNTIASKPTILSGLDRLNKLFAGFRHVPTYTGIVYNAKDLSWAESDAAAYIKQKGLIGSDANLQGMKSLIEAGCQFNGKTPVECGGGMSWDWRDSNSPAGGAYYGVQNPQGDFPDGFWSDANRNVGPMTQVNHEATHNYQITQFYFTPLGKNQHISADLMHAFAPWWFSEGQANAIGIATFVDNLDAYKNVRRGNVTRNPGPNTKLPAFTPAGLKTFLTANQVASPENTNYPLAYTVGYAAVETLVAIGGPQSTLALYTLGAQGKDWETAFKAVYGISWDEGATVLAKVLAAEYAALPIAS